MKKNQQNTVHVACWFSVLSLSLWHCPSTHIRPTAPTTSSNLQTLFQHEWQKTNPQMNPIFVSIKRTWKSLQCHKSTKGLRKTYCAQQLPNESHNSVREEDLFVYILNLQSAQRKYMGKIPVNGGSPFITGYEWLDFGVIDELLSNKPWKESICLYS